MSELLCRRHHAFSLSPLWISPITIILAHLLMKMASCLGPRYPIALGSHHSVFEFLAPRILRIPKAPRRIRCLSSSRIVLAAEVSNTDKISDSSRPIRKHKTGCDAASNPAPLNKPLTQAQRDFLTSAVYTDLHLLVNTRA
jgi:hypothetical protein